MLFNSYAFILAFLPITVLVYHALRRIAFDRAAIGWLVLASLFFYGWWNPVYLLLLVSLIVVNFAAVWWLIGLRNGRPQARGLALAVGVAGNLAVLAYFKYADFAAANIHAVIGIVPLLAPIVLPLGISFFTFQKIALLADTYQGKVPRLNFLDYALFVTFFPQLIAGPIVHHSEVMPQFHRRGRVGADSIALGVAIFTIGLAKKVLLADAIAVYATPQFDAAAAGDALSAVAAWTAALAYTLQLYFDFSGYSDMAVGAALLFGIRLPLNFASPYKAENIIEFWRRWHMTLSRFLRDYLYIPLGGNRRGTTRRYVNLLITMVLGGIWHGAGWTFMIWGLLHGLFLVINHGWRALRRRVGGRFARPHAGARVAGRGLTFLLVVLAWTIFRADGVHSAAAMVTAMVGRNGIGLGTVISEQATAWLFIGALLSLVWFAPNTQEITGYVPPAGIGSEPRGRWPDALRWWPSAGWAVLCGGLFASSFMSLSKVSEFLYFQF
jgi:alginate O-acetyltransferase complex protein AlgI